MNLNEGRREGREICSRHVSRRASVGGSKKRKVVV